MSDGSPRTTEDAERQTVQLLRLAGPREGVSAVRTSRVKAAVHAAWQERVRQRTARTRSRFVAAVLAAALLAFAIGNIRTIYRRTVPLGDPVAVVERTEGMPRRNEAIRAGEWISTGAHARAALRFSDGTSVRLDAGSRIRPLSSTVIELANGGVYVDTERESGRFEVRTPLATARDIGTQFEVRLIDRALRLRVRSGIVELHDRQRSVSGRAGTEITLTASGAASRPIPAHGLEWEWTARVAPPVEMEGRSTRAFLEQVAREHGWELHFADPALAQEAARITLHGSVNGLTPDEMIGTAIAASGLQHRFEDGTVVVLRPKAGDGER